MSITAQVKARANLSLSQAIDIANEAAFHADLKVADLRETATWEQVWERLGWVDSEFPE